MAYKTLKFRIKDKSRRKLLVRLGNAINMVWNHLNEQSFHRIHGLGNGGEADWLTGWVVGSKWPNEYDLQKTLNGAAKEFGLPLSQQSVNAVADEYVTRRVQSKKRKLRWRSSRGSQRSLGWIPLTSQNVKWNNDGVVYMGKHYRVFDPGYYEGQKIRSGSFNQDARGRWYLNLVVEEEYKVPGKHFGGAIGIDPGLKAAYTLSNGEKFPIQQFYRKSEMKLAKAQRLKKKRQVQKLHAKIANQRKDYNHKLSDQITKRFSFIACGDVSGRRLAKTKMAKSVLDVAWTQFRVQLCYKALRQGATYQPVDEKFSSVTCSGCRNQTGPKKGQLSMREWTCSQCGSRHDRDVNAAINILRAGQGTPMKGGSRNVSPKPLKTKHVP